MVDLGIVLKRVQYSSYITGSEEFNCKHDIVKEYPCISGDTDGFPLPASPKDLQKFDEAYFGKSLSSSSKDKRNHGQRSRSIPELLSLSSKLRCKYMCKHIFFRF